MKGYELTGTEVTDISYLHRPRRATWKNWGEYIILAVLIAAITYALIRLASHQ